MAKKKSKNKKRTSARPRFQIVLPSSQVHTGKSDQRIGALLALARAANAITLARRPLMAPLKDSSPAVSREHFSALFYVAAVLYEALRTSEDLERHFADLEHWDEGFGRLLADPMVTTARSSVFATRALFISTRDSSGKRRLSGPAMRSS
jgi:hypothetical protein